MLVVGNWFESGVGAVCGIFAGRRHQAPVRKERNFLRKAQRQLFAVILDAIGT
jgi:hypothetical protein